MSSFKQVFSVDEDRVTLCSTQRDSLSSSGFVLLPRTKLSEESSAEAKAAVLRRDPLPPEAVQQAVLNQKIKWNYPRRDAERLASEVKTLV